MEQARKEVIFHVENIGYSSSLARKMGQMT